MSHFRVMLLFALLLVPAMVRGDAACENCSDTPTVLEVLTQLLEGKIVTTQGSGAQPLGTASGGTTFTLTRRPPVDANAPVAVDDYYVIAAGYPQASIDVLNNDTDPNASTLILSPTLTQLGSAVGTATVKNNKVSYYPPTSLVGSTLTAYSYRVYNSTGNFDNGVVLISVLGESGTAPVIPVEEGTPIQGGGQLANGTYVYIDYAGIGTVYIPNKTNPTTIVYDWSGAVSVVYPGCAGITRLLTDDEYRVCSLTGSLLPGITYVQRIPLTAGAASGTTVPKSITFNSTETGDQLFSYNVSVSKTPGDLNPVDSLCRVANSGYAPIYLATAATGYSCVVTVPTLYYANFRASGDNAVNCNGSLICRMNVLAY